MRRVSMLKRRHTPRQLVRRRQHEKKSSSEEEEDHDKGMEADEEQESTPENPPTTARARRAESSQGSSATLRRDDSATPCRDDSATLRRDDSATPCRDDSATPCRDDSATPCRDDSATPCRDATGLPFSDDVLSSITRSFESRTLESEDEVHFQLATFTRWMDWSVDPDSVVAFYWKAVVTVAVTYNCAIIILRTAFLDMRGQGVFLVLDAMSDIICAVDILLESKTSFLKDGCLVKDSRQTFQHYREKQHFMYDVLSVFPTHSLLVQSAYVSDTLQLTKSHTTAFWKYCSSCEPIFRINRLLKCHAMDKFFQRTESRTNNPNLLRAFKLSLHLGLVIHWIACLYYMLSEFEGLGSNDWVYPLEPNVTRFSRKYILCMFWSTMILTTIGDRPPPVTELEYVFTGLTFLVGVFVFAAVVGNVGDVISNLNAARRDFQARMDQIKVYMNHRNVPEHLQNRIKKWAEYTWDRTKAIDEPSALQFLPDRLRTEVAIHVHLDVLKKVSIFGECEEGLLRELVLKLRPQIFSPGDYICRIGEIGREMYIINHGQVEILYPDFETGNMIQVIVMHPGNFFGEISLLKLDDGQNKRTADVRSIGFSELLCLSRRDLIVALAEYPEARTLLEDYARQRFNNTKKLTPPDTEDSRHVSPRVSCVSTNKKRTARQVFAKVMRQEGFAKLLTSVARNRELTEIRTAVEELKARTTSVQELERMVLEKNLELQRSQAQVSYLEKILVKSGHSETKSEMSLFWRANHDLQTDSQKRDENHLRAVADSLQDDEPGSDSKHVVGDSFCWSTRGVKQYLGNNDDDDDIDDTVNNCYSLRRNSFRIKAHKNVISNEIFDNCSFTNLNSGNCSFTNVNPGRCICTSKIPGKCSCTNEIADSCSCTNTSMGSLTSLQHEIDVHKVKDTETTRMYSVGSRGSPYFQKQATAAYPATDDDYRLQTYVPCSDTVYGSRQTYVPCSDTVYGSRQTYVPCSDTVYGSRQTYVPCSDTVYGSRQTYVPGSDTVYGSRFSNSNTSSSTSVPTSMKKFSELRNNSTSTLKACRFTTETRHSKRKLSEFGQNSARTLNSCRYTSHIRHPDRKAGSVYRPKYSTDTVCSLQHKQFHTAVDSVSARCSLWNGTSTLH